VDYTALITPSLGATGLLALVVLMILTGRLIPRRNLDELRRDKDSQINTWRQAYEQGLKTQDVQRRQITALLESAKTTANVLQALPKAAAISDMERSDHATPTAVAQEDSV
jgi:hypothetical protein